VAPEEEAHQWQLRAATPVQSALSKGLQSHCELLARGAHMFSAPSHH
jgi:hypothetical protein